MNAGLRPVFVTIVLWSFGLTAAIAGEHQQVLDALDYPTAEAARAAWQAGAGTPPVELLSGDVAGVVVSAPFAQQPDLERTIHDREVSYDLSLPAEFVLKAAVDHPEAIAHVSLYFHSPGGWFSGSARLAGHGPQILRFAKADFRTEGSPQGWNTIDGIRISFWRGGEVDAEVQVLGLKGVYHDVALLEPSPSEHSGKDEYRTARDVADRFARMLDELGIGYDRLTDETLTDRLAAARKLLIVPYHPFLDEEAIAALEVASAEGTKLFLNYQLPRPLARRLGIGQTQYVAQSQPGQFAQIRLDTELLPGAPPVVHQSSWNITDATPLAAGTEVVGRWYDRDGNDTGRAALVVGPRGAFFSHVILGGDLENKKLMLAAVLAKLQPELWHEIYQATLTKAGQVGTLDSLEKLEDMLAESASPQAEEAQQEFRNGNDLLRQAHAAIEDNPPAAVQLAQQAKARFARAYLLAQPSPSVEGRAIWNHSGTGAYPGDWERTARELADAGFNIVLPNMLWGGLAHYPSELLPQSSTYAKHGDQIAQCVAACHKHGIEVHVWKVNFNLSTAPQSFVEKMRTAGRTQVNYRGEAVDWLCPSHPENQRLELESMLEVARRYDVDGLHFDYIRYPGPQTCFCDGCRRRFQEETGIEVENWPKDCHSGRLVDAYRDWRCEQINRLVEAVAREAEELDPALKVSAAVFGSYPDCRNSVGQDWPHWIRAGWLDFVCPMDYTQDDARFRALVSNQMELVDGAIPLYPGIGAWRLATPDRVVGQISIARELGADGFTIFNLDEQTPQLLLGELGIGPGREPAETPHNQ